MVEADVSPGDVDPDMRSALQSIMEELIDEVSLGLCFEIHRSCKIGSFFLDGYDETSDTEYAIVERHGVDVLGQAPSKKNYECVCPNCQRPLAASRFAPHLEKCMGMGRNSSRIASRRIANNQKHGSDESGQEDENDNDWKYAQQPKRLRKMKRDKMSNTPRNRRLAKLRNNNFHKLRNGTGSNHTATTSAASAVPVAITATTSSTSTAAVLGATELPDGQDQVPNYESMTLEERKALLLARCGVISEHTKKMCTRSTKCAQHTDEQRRLVRQYLLRQNPTQDLEDIHIDIDTYDDAESQSLRESLQWEASSNSSPADSTSTNNSTSCSVKRSNNNNNNNNNNNSSSSKTSKSSKSKKSKSIKTSVSSSSSASSSGKDLATVSLLDFN